jgi:hypothetical protein
MNHGISGAIGLGLGSSKVEIKAYPRQLACKYHLDKNDSTITGLAAEGATEFFKLLSIVN